MDVVIGPKKNRQNPTSHGARKISASKERLRSIVILPPALRKGLPSAFPMCFRKFSIGRRPFRIPRRMGASTFPTG